jgi:ABC-type lipoprotein release transport system permease subunit
VTYRHPGRLLTLTDFLVLSAVRRRHEAGLLKALGFVRQQVAFAVSWQTTTVAVIGILVGLPTGTALGRVVWRLFAANLGVTPVPVVGAGAIAAVALGTIVVANLLAIVPASLASRSRAAQLLRVE